MKHVYLFIVFVFFINLTNAQDEQLLGQWTMDSIWDFDILLENPANPITIEFNGETSSIIINSFCGQTYESFYTPSTLENSFDITATSWNYMACSEDTQGFEGATNLLLDLDFNSTEPKTLTYIITNDGITTTLELTHSYVVDETPTSTTGFFTKVSTPLNPELILGDWFLYNTNVQGTYRYNAQLGDGQPKITFTNTPTSNGLAYTGSNCNDFFGSYVSNSDGTITKLDYTTTLNECDDDNTDAFRLSYTFNVLGDVEESTLSYQITGTGANEVLQLTNLDNSSYATFGRQQLSPNVLGEWYLYYLVIDSNQIDKPVNTLPTIEFTSNPNNTAFYFGGVVACTGYAGDYYFNPQQTFSREGGLTTTLGNPCDTNEENVFENLYFYFVLDTDVVNDFDYEILGTGVDATLVITNLSNGNQAFYGRQALSVDENISTSFKISLDKNPVTTTLGFSNSQELSAFDYNVYSITGKRVLSGNFNSNTIDVKPLQPGLYILKVSNGTYQFETVKFIKE